MKLSFICLVLGLGLLQVTGALAVDKNLTLIKEAPGAPGIRHYWPIARKDAVATAFEDGTANSPVWFTLAEGVLSEVFYPTVDRPQIGDLQLLITDGNSFFSEQKRDVRAQVSYLGQGLGVRVSGSDSRGAYQIEQEIVSDPNDAVVRISTRVKLLRPGLRIFVLFKPAIQGRASDDSARYSRTDRALLATDEALVSGARAQAALVASPTFVEGAVGYVGTSDGWQDLSRNYRLTQLANQAGPGNVALTGEIPVPANATEARFELALGFGSEGTTALQAARRSLARPFASLKSAFESGWRRYSEKMEPASRLSAMIIKTHEDKRHPGAIVASLSKPGIPEGERTGEPLNPDEVSGGYHLVWPRDLYHAAMGLLAAGDARTPVQVLRYLLSTQSADGSWAQNFWVDATPYWTGLQLDEVAFPIMLALQLQSRGLVTLGTNELAALRRAARFIQSHGPFSPQDRWEEIGGAIPSTIAAEIAGLRAFARLAGDTSAMQTAESWKSQIERWTLVPQGPLGSRYFLRVSPSGDPLRNEPIFIANGGGPAMSQEIIDGGFLELVRHGVRAADDAGILSTLGIYLNPANGVSQALGGLSYQHLRYTRDAYGLEHRGRFWPLLTGESAHYFAARGDWSRATAGLSALEGMASPAGLIPEQTEGAAVASPLVWAHAEAIRLRRSIQEGRVFDLPPQSPTP